MTRETDNLYHDMLNSGEMYDSVDDQFIAYQHELVQKLNDFNRTDETPEGLAMRDEMLRDMCGTYGENLYIIPPIHANCIVVGNPAKVLRQITEDDDRFEGGKPIPQALIDKYM